MDKLPLIVMLILFFTFILAEIVLLRRWKGLWRVGAALPGIALVVVTLNILAGTFQDRTTHNLWPLEIVVWSAGGLLFLGALAVARCIFAKCPGSAT